MKSDNKFLFDHYKHIYFYEIEQKDKLDASIVLPAGVNTAMAGLTAFFINKAFSTPVLWLGILWGVLILLEIVSLVRSIYHLVLAYISYQYIYLMSSAEVNKYHEELSDYYKSHDQKKNVSAANREVIEMIQRSYIEAATHNAQINDWKSKHLHLAKKRLVECLVLSIVCIMPFIATEFLNKYSSVVSDCKCQTSPGE